MENCLQYRSDGQGRLPQLGLDQVERPALIGQLEGERMSAPMGVDPLGDPGSPGQAVQQGPDVGRLERLGLQHRKEVVIAAAAGTTS